MPQLARMSTIVSGSTRLRDDSLAARRRAAALTRERAARRWVRAMLGRTAHERRVAANATILFNLLRPLHRLPRRELRLLRLAALVHDVGRAIDDDDHPTVGAGLVLEQMPVAMTRCRRRRLAYLTRYHRGAVPELGRDDVLRSGDARAATRILLAMLRAADTLNCRQLPPPRLEFVFKNQQDRRPRLKIIVRTTVDPDLAKRAFARDKKYRLLSDLLDVRVDVDVQSTDR